MNWDWYLEKDTLLVRTRSSSNVSVGGGVLDEVNIRRPMFVWNGSRTGAET